MYGWFWILFFLKIVPPSLSTEVTTLSDKNGTIIATLKSVLQEFNFRLTPGTRVAVKWQSFGLNGDMPYCRETYLEVTTGGCSKPVTSFGRLCGKPNEPLPIDIYSNDHCITLRLYAHNPDLYRHPLFGFKATYNEMTMNNVLPSSNCFQKTGSVYHTANWPQPYNLYSGYCNKYDINIPSLSAMKVFVMSVQTEDTPPSTCDTNGSDILQVESPWTCGWHYTDWNNDGNGNVVYLDRHRVNCPTDQVVNTFRLQRNNANQYRYMYKCCPARDPCLVVNKKTPSSSGSVKSLNAFDVQCGYKSYVSSFKFSRSSDRKTFHYEYSCCNVNKSPVTCNDKSTGRKTMGKTYYLSAFNVQCPTTSNYIGIRSFRVRTRTKKNNRKSKTEFWYTYQCCYHSSESVYKKKFCGDPNPSLLEFYKGTSRVSFEFVRQSLTNNNKTGAVIGYTMYPSDPSYYFGAEKYLIPRAMGNYYIGQKETDSLNYDIKELVTFTGGDFQKFRIVPGLNGVAGCVSFQSSLITDDFIYVHENKKDLLLSTQAYSLQSYNHFVQSASFIIHDNKYQYGYVGIQWYNDTKKYMIVESEKLKLRNIMSSTDKELTKIRLTGIAPVKYKAPVKKKSEPYWIIPIVLISLIFFANFVKKPLIARQARIDKEDRDRFLKAISDAYENATENDNGNHAEGMTNIGFQEENV